MEEVTMKVMFVSMIEKKRECFCLFEILYLPQSALLTPVDTYPRKTLNIVHKIICFILFCLAKARL